MIIMNENLLIILILSLGGLLIRQALVLTGQNWAKSYQQTIAFLVLPFVTFVITKTISGNISLSLGMIGAMSIVRFRNPVKSPLELVMYFALITLGIAANVKYQWAVSLIFVIIFIIIIVNLVNLIFKKYNKSFFNISFHEGSSLHLLEIYSSEKIDFLNNHENLKIFLSYPKDSEYVYKLAFINKNSLFKLNEEIENYKSIKKIDINLV